MLTLCMIVKNEEETLKNCLSSAASLVDEIIVIDTGSTDKTKRIALDFTDKVYDFDWCNDFAKARNYSLQFASNDWILVLDGDEEVLEADKKELLDFIKKDPKSIGRIHRTNIIDDTNDIRIYNERINRFFNKKYYHYEGKIHEQVTPIYEEDDKITMVHIPIFINHIGYKEQVIKKTNKIQRNIDILLEEIGEKPNDSYLYYQLGKSKFLNKQYKEAAGVFEKAINLLDDFHYEYTEDLIETYGYSLINCGYFDRALDILKYEKYYNNSDFLFVKSLILMNNSKFKDAAEGFLKCTEFKECKSIGVNTFKAFYNVGVIFEVLGFRKEALEYYSLCGGYRPANIRLNKLK